MKAIIKKHIVSPFLSIYRKKFIRKKIAFGEKSWYKIQTRFLCVDISESDININLETDDFHDYFHEVDNIYTCHTLEHVNEKNVDRFINQSFIALKKGGVLRIEVPDVDLILEDYLSSGKYIESIAKENKNTLVDKMGYNELYSENYIAFVGCVSCFIDYTKSTNHIPVTPLIDIFKEKLNSLKKEEFFDWLISLQTEAQIKSHGHISWYNYEKLFNKLKKAGFKKIVRVKPGTSNYDFDLILERPNDKRANFSLILEAKKI